MPCCDKCDARQIPPIHGALTCWDPNCECHRRTMMAHQPAQAQVSPETKLTIAKRCADPEFQSFIKLVHPLPWARGEKQGLSPQEITEKVLSDTCGVTTEHHPEYLALVNAFDRERAQVADLHTKEN